MKIVILRGGLNPRPRRKTAGTPASTRERGVMAIGDGAGRWVLLNMSPSVAHQLDSAQGLNGHDGLHDADVRAVLLSDAQVDHVGGLLSLRDGAPIDLYATPAVFEALTTALPVLPVLQHYCGVHWRVVPVAGDRHEASFQVEGMPSLSFTAIATRAPTPPHLGHDPMVGDSIALAVQDLDTGRRLFCAPGLVQAHGHAGDWMVEADCLLVDRPDPLGDTAGDRAWLDHLMSLPAQHKVLFEPTATRDDPARRQALADRGFALAYDGMAIEL